MVYDICLKLKEIRLNKQMSQEDVAKRAGITQEMVARVEGGTVNPRLSTFIKITTALDLKVVLE